MRKDYILLCWAEFVIPVPVWAKWMAFDGGGELWVYANKPIRANTYQGDYWTSDNEKMELVIGNAIKVPPPESGGWATQVYKLEDI